MLHRKSMEAFIFYRYIKKILYYLHRTSGGVRIEDVAEAMGLLIEDGLIRGWGLSQVDVDIIERAQNVTPLSAIQNIYSMVERDIEKAVITDCFL